MPAKPASIVVFSLQFYLLFIKYKCTYTLVQKLVFYTEAGLSLCEVAGHDRREKRCSFYLQLLKPGDNIKFCSKTLVDLLIR